jgi:hypothetical protein
MTGINFFRVGHEKKFENLIPVKAAASERRQAWQMEWAAPCGAQQAMNRTGPEIVLNHEPS